MYQKSLILSPKQIFLFTNKLQKNRFKKSFIDVQIKLGDKNIKLRHNNERKLEQTMQWIKQNVKYYDLQIIKYEQQMQWQIQSLNQLYEFDRIKSKPFLKLIDILKQRGGEYTYKYFADEISVYKDFVVFVSQYRELENIMKKLNVSQFKLQVNNQKIFILYLIHDFSHFYNDGLNMILKNKQMQFQGPQKLCKNIFDQIKLQLQTIQINTIPLRKNNINYPYIANSIKNSLQNHQHIKRYHIFFHYQLQNKCKQAYQEYQIYQPIQYYQFLKSQYQTFCLIIAHKNHINELSKIIEFVIKPLNRQKSKNLQKEVELQRKIINRNDYDKNDFERWFKKNRKIKMENIKVIQRGQDVEIILYNRVYDNELKSSFNIYFEFEKGIFFKEEENEQLLEKLRIELCNRHKNMNIKYINGYSRYRYDQIINDRTILKNICRMISNNQYKKIKKANHLYQFKCFFIKGLKNIGDIIQKQSQILFINLNKQFHKLKNITWNIQIPQYIQNNDILISKMKQIILNSFLTTIKIIQLIQITTQLTHFILKLDVSNLKQLQNTQIIEHTFIQSIKNKYKQLQIRYELQQQQLKSIVRLDNNNYNIIKKDGKLYMVGFEIGEMYGYLSSEIQKSKKTRFMQVGYQKYGIIRQQVQILLNNNNNNYKIQLKKDKQYMNIILIGLQIKIIQIINRLQKKIEQQLSNINRQYIRINKIQYQHIKSQLVSIKQSQFIHYQFKQNTYPNYQIIFPNQNHIIFQHYPISSSKSQIMVIRNTQDIIQFQSKISINDQLKFYPPSLFTINSNSYKTKTILSYIFQNYKHTSISLYLKKNIPKTDLLQIIRFISKIDKQIPIIYIASRNQQQSQIINKNIKIIQSNQLTYGQQQQPKWFWLQTKKYPYNQKCNDKINSQIKKGKKIILLQANDLQITQKTHQFLKDKNKMIHVRGTQYIQCSKIGDDYYYIVNNKQYKLGQSEKNKIQKSGLQMKVDLTIALYQINVNEMHQLNLFTNFKRKISSQKLKKKHDCSQYIVKQLKKQFILQLSSYKDTKVLKQYINNIKNILKSFYKIQQSIIINQKIFSEEITNIAQKNHLKILSYKRANDTIQIQISSHHQQNIQDFKSFIKLKQYQYQNNIIYPPFWQKLPQTTIQVKVSQNTQQFKKISQQFQIKPIKQLYRIQNISLWKKYSQEKKDIQKRSQSVIKQIYLFHGTSMTNPQVIYKDKQQSFNFNYANDRCFFGRGIYFAKKAKYSNSYSFQKDGLKSMLYCRVQVGQSQQQMVVKQQHKQIKDTQIRDKQRNIRYQSIHSYYGDSDIYIIYKFRRAYPAYLIKY